MNIYSDNEKLCHRLMRYSAGKTRKNIYYIRALPNTLTPSKYIYPYYNARYQKKFQ